MAAGKARDGKLYARKTIDRVVAALLTGVLPVVAATFPLEWNTTYDTSVPHEVEILPGKEGLCHISKLARTRVENVSDVLSVGQVIPVKLIEIDRTGGRLSLSYIDAIDPDGEDKSPKRPAGDRDRKPRNDRDRKPSKPFNKGEKRESKSRHTDES